MILAIHQKVLELTLGYIIYDSSDGEKNKDEDGGNDDPCKSLIFQNIYKQKRRIFLWNGKVSSLEILNQ